MGRRDENGLDGEEIDANQVSIIESPIDSRQFVEAGPGTGKTAVACSRVAFFLNAGSAPSKILLISFTRTAVAEIRNRIDSHCVDDRGAAGVHISTIDSFVWTLRTGFAEAAVSALFGGYEASITDVLILLGQKHRILLGFLEEYDHVIVDEAQDVVGIRAKFIVELLSALRPDCGVTIFSDPAQAIFDFTSDATDDTVERSPPSVDRKDFLLDFITDENNKFEFEALTKIYRTSDPTILRAFSSCREVVLRKTLSGIERIKTLRATVAGIFPERPVKICKETIDSDSDTLVLYRRRVEVLIASSIVQSEGVNHRIRMPGLPVVIYPWIGRLFGDYLPNHVDRESFIRLWADRYIPACFDGFSLDDAWAQLVLHAGDRRGNYVDLVRLRKILSGARPPLEFCSAECGWDGPIIGTIHASKGRESPRVMVMLPPEVRDGPKVDFEAEARVFYVGITRAREELSLGLGYSRMPSELGNGRTYIVHRVGPSANVEIGRPRDFSIADLVSRPDARRIQDLLASLPRRVHEVTLQCDPSSDFSLDLYVKNGIRVERIGALSKSVDSDLWDIGKNVAATRKMSDLRPIKRIKNLALVAVGTVAVSDEFAADTVFSYQSSKIFLVPIVRGFPLVEFVPYLNKREIDNMTQLVKARNRIVCRLIEDLVGPGSADEEIGDRPSDRYLTGILYPQDSHLSVEEDDQLGMASDDDEEADTEGVPLNSAIKPSTAGISFAISSGAGGGTALIDFDFTFGTYRRIEGAAATEADTKGDLRKARRPPITWKRTAHEVQVKSVPAKTGKVPLPDDAPKDVELFLQVAIVGENTILTAVLVNKNQVAEKRSENEERMFFQVALWAEASGTCVIVARPAVTIANDDDSRTAALIYRDAVELAVGHTCSATWGLDENSKYWVATDWIPICEVPAISIAGDKVFETLHQQKGTKPLWASWLATASQEDMIRGLALLVECYTSWVDAEEKRIPRLRLSAQDASQAKEHVRVCRIAGERMRQGIQLLATDSEVRLAFQLAQGAMLIQYQWVPKNAAAELEWRPFQLAFQILTIASIAGREHADRKIMDLLWFPTGGGKTEAYLALTAITLFLRRLRASAKDDGGGVAVLMRYTLRLLTIQQFQRASAMVMACELLRRRSVKADGRLPNLGSRPFSIGLWVGGDATPNKRADAMKPARNSDSTPEQISQCPACLNQLTWKRTKTECCPHCLNPKCELSSMGQALPIWTVDEDIYDRAPSLVIGTVDKFAQIPRNLRTGILFGLSTPFSPPDLIIQDELHLISGPLGTITALYEVAVDELSTRAGIRPKIIGSTATIRRAGDQIRSLFNRDAFQFPPPGIDAGNSGFAVYDEASPGRLYLGISTAGRSAKYTLQAVAAAMLQSVFDSEVPVEARDPYWTLVGYFNALRELGGSLILMQDDVPVTMKQIALRRGETLRKISAPAELNSSVPSREIPIMLQELQKKAGEDGAYDSVLASNMISVGVDVPRLGSMLVNGQPKSLAEYIQATSRVGRGKVPGLVVSIFYNSRARDRSRFETFSTWHRSIYKDVEATSVTPFSSRAQDKALHAVLVSLVRHLLPEMRDNPVLRHSSREKAEGLASLIEGRVALVDERELSYATRKLELLLDQWEQRSDVREYWEDFGKSPTLLISAEQHAALQALSGGATGDGLLRGVWPTPNSMRDVEPGIPFALVPGLVARGGRNA